MYKLSTIPLLLIIIAFVSIIVYLVVLVINPNLLPEWALKNLEIVLIVPLIFVFGVAIYAYKKLLND